ncbi:MAG TPA: hypothetical protein VGG56_10105 [Terracidiphilus sp.]|jgi:hypothetical protein
MNPDRRNLLKTLPVVASAALAWPAAQAGAQTANVTLTVEPAPVTPLHPLEQVTLHIAGSGWENGTVVIVDGAGHEYVRTKAASQVPFTIGGALGRHAARIVDERGTVSGEMEFAVDCTTHLNDEGGLYRGLMEAVLWTMMSWSDNNPVQTIRYNDRVYQFFANWIFDHTLIMKGMKYYWPDLKDAIDFFADTQREDGMIWENCYPATPDYNFFDWKFNYDGFVKRIGDGFWQLRRAPVESHVEQYFVEGLYYTWKSTGDIEWMKGKLDAAMRALRFIPKSPYRWSEKYQLMHRGFTIDTWDYVSDDQQRFGGSVFMVYLGKSEFGVFHGDNTNLIARCRNLAEMLKVAGRGQEAPEFEKLADDVEQRLNSLAWNGNFYTHWIAENPDYKPDVGVDMSIQVSLSNAYALNRGISHDKCVSVIKTYQRIKREMPASSPGEFYGIYPPFQRDFTLNIPGLVWEYCNGGVLTVVGGELAHGAFEHGYETYGADILRRIKSIADRYRGYLPVTLRGRAAETPQRTFAQVDIKDKANASYREAAAELPLWSKDEKILADLPAGHQEFQGVPFQVLDQSQSAHGSCIVLSRQTSYASQLLLPVGAKATSIYLLGAADGRDAGGLLLTIHYTDGTFHSADVEGHSWAFPSDSKYAKAGPRTEDTYRVAWKKSTPDEQEFGVYATGINNPHADKEIASLEFSVGSARSRWLILAVTLSSAPVFFAPYDDLSTGIPDGWTGSVIYALIEGLAGIKDGGAAFSRTKLTPRWHAADVPSAEVTVRYPSSTGYCSYKYRAGEHKVDFEFTGSAEEFEVQLLLPPNVNAGQTRLDGSEVKTTLRRIEDSSYLVLTPTHRGVHRVEVDLA